MASRDAVGISVWARPIWKSTRFAWHHILHLWQGTCLRLLPVGGNPGRAGQRRAGHQNHDHPAPPRRPTVTSLSQSHDSLHSFRDGLHGMDSGKGGNGGKRLFLFEHVKQASGVIGRLQAQRGNHFFIAATLGLAGDDAACPVDQRMEPPNTLDQHPQESDPRIAPAGVDQFMGQNRLQLGDRPTTQQAFREDDRVSQKADDRRAHWICGHQ